MALHATWDGTYGVPSTYHLESPLSATGWLAPIHVGLAWLLWHFGHYHCPYDPKRTERQTEPGESKCR